MIERATESGFGSWKVPQLALAIEYSPAVIEEIRAAACQALNEIPRGQEEAGGVLFGTRSENTLRISAWRPLSCQHLEGPALRLSARDRLELACLIEVARRTPELKDLQPVGWFVSHPKGELALTTSDLEIYYNFFPYPWQVTLVMQPSEKGTARAGFFLREADGSVKSDATYQEFAVAPQPGLRADTAALEPAIFSWASAAKPAEPPKPVAPAIDKSFLAPEPELASPSRPFADTSLFAKLRPALPPRWIWAIVALVVAALVGFLIKGRSSAGFQNVSLGVTGSNETMQISWDRNSPAIRDARWGVLDITDGGGKPLRLSLTADQLHTGGMTYIRHSDDVSLFLRVYPPTGPAVEGFARLIAPLDIPAAPPAVAPAAAAPAAPSAELQAEREALRTQVSQLEAEVRKQVAERNRLQDLIRILENRLNVEGARKPDDNQDK